MTKLRSAAVSDIGKLRSHNEDRFVQDDRLGLYGVADGVGGLPGGEEAAQLAIEEILRLAPATRDVPTGLIEAVQSANEVISDLGQRISPRTGIGTTLTFALVRDNTLHLAHVGDSRCYVWKENRIELLTRDHSVESDARLRRARGELVFYHEANRNALTRCMGQPTPVEVDVLSRPLTAGERYLICTDGVTRLIRESELGEMLSRGDDPANTAKEMVDLANKRGGPDNSTTVIIHVIAE